MESVDLVQPVEAKRPPHGGLFCPLLALSGHANSSEQCPLLTQSGHRGQFRQTLAASIKVQV
jgi:hypothetical protein